MLQLRTSKISGAKVAAVKPRGMECDLTATYLVQELCWNLRCAVLA